MKRYKILEFLKELETRVKHRILAQKENGVAFKEGREYRTIKIKSKFSPWEEKE